MYVKGSDDDKSPLNDESREVYSSKLNPLRFHVNDGIDDEDGRKEGNNQNLRQILGIVDVTNPTIES